MCVCVPSKIRILVLSAHERLMEMACVLFFFGNGTKRPQIKIPNDVLSFGWRGKNDRINC